VPGPPLISVIIPVYNVAAYLPECLDSVLGPGGDVEVIAVDDASPDGCGALLAERAAADPRLHVVSRAVNGGPGAARNAGLALAAGEYAWFVDADDRLADGALAAVTAALRGRPDVLLIGWDATFDGPPGRAARAGRTARTGRTARAGARTVPGPGRDVLAWVPAAGGTLEGQPGLINLSMTSWSKLLRREFLAKLGVTFGPGIHEDVIVTCAALLAAESVGAVARPCYRYRRDRRGQFMGTAGPGHLGIFEAYRQVFELVDARAAAGTPAGPAVRAAIFERAIWHYTTVFQATGPWPGRGSLVPPGARRAFFARMHADFMARRPPGYRRPRSARGLKFALIERDAYLAYVALEPVNRLRVAAGAVLAGRGGGREAGNG
jgi:CDP-glycerol glycerophosphotransferase